jgi:hypothetical protein
MLTLVKTVTFANGTMTVLLSDYRAVTVPLDWFPRLQAASPEQRSQWEKAGAGCGIHFPEIDEDISVAGIQHGSYAMNMRAQ